MLDKLEITDEKFSKQFSKDIWPELKSQLVEKFLSKNRDEWAMIFKNSDACITPILDLDERQNMPVNQDQHLLSVMGVQPNPSQDFQKLL